MILLLLFFGVAKLNAQVTIGADVPPKSYSVLELVAQYNTDEYGGLLLPLLTTAERNLITGFSVAESYGLMIYNTDIHCVEYWNSKKWVSLCVGRANITLHGDICDYDETDLFSAGGTEFPPCIYTPKEEPDCIITSGAPFQVYLVTGSAYATLEVNEFTSAFSVLFSENNSSLPRFAIVRVVSNCTTEHRDFIFTQQGATCPPSTTAFGIGSTSTELCGNNGAVIAWITTPQEGMDYLWTINGVIVHTGNYYQITRAGTYKVYAGKYGCDVPPALAQTLVITQSPGTSPGAPTLQASNGGILCSGGSVVLTAVNGIASSFYWFQNGALFTTTSMNTLTVSGASAAGEWFVTQQDGNCGSKMSNIVTLIDHTSGGGNALPLPIATVNGTLLTGNPVVCKNGTLELEVINTTDYPTGTKYEWFNNGISIYYGEDPVIYTVAPTTDYMILSVQVSNSSDGCPSTTISPLIPVTYTAPNATTINSGAGTAPICGSSPAILIATNSTGVEYQWFKDNISISGANTSSYNATQTGNYTVRYKDANGCWSIVSTPIRVIQSAYFSVLNWQVPPTNPVTVGSVESYTVYAFPQPDSYTWSSSNTAVATVTPIPPGNTVSVNYVTIGQARIKVEVSNPCGTASLDTLITVQYGCAPITNVTITPNIPITKKLDVNGVPKTPADASTMFQSSTSPAGVADNYGFYVSTNNGVSYTPQQTGPSNTFVYTTPTTAGTYLIYASADNLCTPMGNIKSPVVPVIVNRDFPIDPSGAYRINGKTCYDVWVTDWPAGNDCMPKVARIDDFGGGYSFNYNFIATKSFSNLTFEFEDPDNLVASHSQSGTGGAILTVNFDPSVKTKATGTNRVTAKKVIIIAKYKDNTGADKQVTLDVLIQDCSCGCTVAKQGGGYITFMCYNLGANPIVQSMSPTQQAAHTTPANNYGDLYSWGRQATGYEKRNSPKLMGPLSGTNQDPVTGQIIGPYAGHFVFSNNKIPWDWRDPQINTLWGPIKTINDPCPAGWRVPTQAEWASIFRGGATNGAPNTATANVWTWNATGTPGYLVRPLSSSTPTLFLPAAGGRYFVDGEIFATNVRGVYWSSTNSTIYGYANYFSNENVNPAQILIRSYGFSIRCVQE